MKMKMDVLKAGLAVLTALSGYAFAMPVSYGEATHSSTNWQELGAYDSNGNVIDPLGTTWSTDGGLTWGREDLFVGDVVQFKFEMHKNFLGTHEGDYLKAWLDLDQSGEFETDESIAFWSNPVSGVQAQHTDNSYAQPHTSDFTILSEALLLSDEHAGEFWMRVRTTCSHSLVEGIGGQWADQWNPNVIANHASNFSATGYYYQGDVENWKIVVHSVSEPGVASLLALGLMGLLLRRRNSLQA